MKHYVSFKRVEDKRDFLIMGPYKSREDADTSGKEEAKKMTEKYGTAIVHGIVPAATARRVAVSA